MHYESECAKKSGRLSLPFHVESVGETKLIESFRGRQKKGEQIFLHFCGSLDPFLMQQNELFEPFEPFRP